MEKTGAEVYEHEEKEIQRRGLKRYERVKGRLKDRGGGSFKDQETKVEKDGESERGRLKEREKQGS